MNCITMCYVSAEIKLASILYQFLDTQICRLINFSFVFVVILNSKITVNIISTQFEIFSWLEYDLNYVIFKFWPGELTDI